MTLYLDELIILNLALSNNRYLPVRQRSFLLIIISTQVNIKIIALSLKNRFQVLVESLAESCTL